MDKAHPYFGLGMLFIVLILALLVLARCRRGDAGRVRGGELKARQEEPVYEQLKPGDYTRQIIVGGLTRTYLLHIPQGLDQTKPAPLILGLHGGASEPQGFARVTQLSDVGGSAGFILVYPAGLWRAWNAGDCCGPAQRRKVDDVAFIRALMEDLSTVVNYDTRRVYATGWSNGGKMVYRLACELSDRLAAIAVVGSSLGVSDCHPQRPVPLLHFHGTADDLHPYQGGRSIAPNVDVEQGSAPDTIQRWTRINGCTGAPRVTYKNGAATCFTYTNCQQGATVTICTIEGMGHQWPGHTLNVTPEQAKKAGVSEMLTRLGPGTNDIDATRMIVEFFKNHPMTAPSPLKAIK